MRVREARGELGPESEAGRAMNECSSTGSAFYNEKEAGRIVHSKLKEMMPGL